MKYGEWGIETPVMCTSMLCFSFTTYTHTHVSQPVPADDIPKITEFMISLVSIPAGRPDLTATQHINTLKAFIQPKTM